MQGCAAPGYKFGKSNDHCSELIGRERHRSDLLVSEKPYHLLVAVIPQCQVGVQQRHRNKSDATRSEKEGKETANKHSRAAGERKD